MIIVGYYCVKTTKLPHFIYLIYAVMEKRRQDFDSLLKAASPSKQQISWREKKPCSENVSSSICKIYRFVFLSGRIQWTTAINLNNAFYFGIFENYSMNGSFRLKNEEKLMPERSQKRKNRALSVNTQGWKSRL